MFTNLNRATYLKTRAAGMWVIQLLEIRKQTKLEIPNVQSETMGVEPNRGTPKSSILIGISIINHPFLGTPIYPHFTWYFPTPTMSCLACPTSVSCCQVFAWGANSHGQSGKQNLGGLLKWVR